MSAHSGPTRRSIPCVGLKIVSANLRRQGPAGNGVEHRAEDLLRVDLTVAVEVGGLDDVFNAPVTRSGTAVPPPPIAKLCTSSGWVAAANSAAALPTSGPPKCTDPNFHSWTSRTRNPPIGRGDSRSKRRSDCPNPGRSIARSEEHTSELQ